jgi:hypothetical protein
VASGGDRKATYRLIGALVAGLAIGAFVVLTVTGAFCSCSGSNSGSSSASIPSQAATPTPTATTAPTASKGLTQAVLSPVNGGNAGGKALFGRIKNTPILQVEAQGLDPSPSGQSYTVWLYRSPKLVLRVGAVKVGKSGGIAAQFPIPTQVLAYVAGGAFDQMDLSLTSDAAYKAEVAKAKKEKRLPEYTGEDILRGKITGPAVKK